MQMTNCNGHMRRNDDAGKLITSNLRMMQVIVGTSIFFMNLDPDRYDYTLVNTKLHFFWKKWSLMKLKVSFPGMWIPTLRGLNHCVLMDEAYKHIPSQRPMEYLKSINRVRIHLKALTLGDYVIMMVLLLIEIW